MFYDLLTAEADALAETIAAVATTARGTPRASTESHRLRRDLEEIHRCLDNLRDRFPEATADS